jgi:hypothetical protein
MARIFNQQLSAVRDFQTYLTVQRGGRKNALALQDMTKAKRRPKHLSREESETVETKENQSEGRPELVDIILQNADDFILQVTNRLAEIGELQDAVGQNTLQVSLYHYSYYFPRSQMC